MTIEVGTQITHGQREYRIKELIAEGGFGRAFLAERTKPTAKPVVVKVPAPAVMADAVWSQKFAREARILANIRHPNVVKIIAYLEFDDGDRALVQELVTGASELDAYLAANPASASSVYLQTLYALRAFHDRATPAAVHRDLSPRNILISDAGQVKVIDFGLAKEDPRATQVLTVAGAWFGTPGCMAPEQLRDSASVDHRADLFAVGRSFAAALQGRNPQYADPSRLPEPWRTICLRLSEHDPADRYASAEEAIVDAMTRFAAAGIPLENFELHAEEMRLRPTPGGWPELCWRQFDLPDFDQSTVELASALHPAVFASAAFDARAFLDRLEASTACSNFDKGRVAFEDADPLGRLYENLYPSLDLPRKLVCFTRLCRTAIDLHRYPVMGNVRGAYGSEPDDAVRAQLMGILDREDPARIIYGRGVIPRVP